MLMLALTLNVTMDGILSHSLLICDLIQSLGFHVNQGGIRESVDDCSRKKQDFIACATF